MIHKSLSIRLKLTATITLLALVATPSYAQEAAIADASITFEQIYANPEDAELNLNYARQEAEKGNLLSAASTLERLLIEEPNWDSARLYYALVLYKLDDRQAALRELAQLDSRPLTPAQREQVEAYRQDFETGDVVAKSDKFAGRASIGVRYDDNAGNAFADSVIINPNQSDIAFVGYGGIQFTTPISDPNGVRFNASASGQIRKHETFSESDYDTFGGKVGVSDGNADWNWSLDVDARQANIGGEKYLTQWGPEINVSKTVSETVSLTLKGAYYDQNYRDLSFTVGESDRSGGKYLILPGIKFRPSSGQLITVEAGYEDKDANTPAFAYDGWRIQGNWVSRYSNGTYLRGYAAYRSLNYDGLAAPMRDDEHFNGRVSFGAPINTVGNWLGITESRNTNGFSVETGINYTNRSSNIQSFEFENFGAELRLILDF